MSDLESSLVTAESHLPPGEQTVVPRFNIFGILALIGAPVALVLGLVGGLTIYSWDSPQVLGCFLVAGELTVFFFINEYFTTRPLLRSFRRVDNLAPRAGSALQSLRAGAAAERWHALPVIGILLISAFLDLCQITQNGLGNIYYAATIKSMSMNWHNFFFASFDPSGFIAMDKPPLALWLQVISTKIVGFNGFGLVLPLILAGVASVAVLYHLVRRSFGTLAGWLAALFLALTPVTVVASRATTMDGLLTLVVLLSAWAVIKAVETGSLRWLLLGSVLLGLGFNIKMIEAYLILPALFLLYLRAAPHRRRVRVGHLVLATVVLLVISLSWSIIVDSVAAMDRPYVGSSGNNTEIGLALGYNGIERPLVAILALLLSGATPTGGAHVIGELFVLAGGPPRLFTLMGTPDSWLLPLGLVGILASGWWKRQDAGETPGSKKRLTPQQQAFILWVTWFVFEAIFFTFDVLVQSYYLVMLAPPVAALAGIGSVELWRDYRKSGWRGWLLLVAFVLTLTLQVSLIAHFADYSRWLAPIIVIVSVLVVVMLIWLRLVRRPETSQANEGTRLQPGRFTFLRASVATLGIAVLLFAPTVWSIATTQHPANGPVPVAGPARPADNDPFILFSQSVVNYAQVDPQLVRYLEANRGQARYLVATSTSLAAAPFIVQSGLPVMPLGGFNGNDQIFTVDQLESLIRQGQVRYFWLSPFFLSSAQIEQLDPRLRSVMHELAQEQSTNTNYLLLNWVSSHCAFVAGQQWGGSGPAMPDSSGAPQLYDCANVLSQTTS